MIVDLITDRALAARTLVCTFVVLLVTSIIVRWWRERKLPPGPCGIPFIGAAPLIIMSKESPQDTFLRWSRTYGKIFSLRVGKRIFVVLNDFVLIQQALNHKQMQDRPTQTLEAIYKASGADHGVSSGNGLFWREQRKFMHSTLRDLGITKRVFESKIRTEVEVFAGRLSELEGKPFDPRDLCVSACTNIICGIAFGRQYSYDDAELRKLINLVTTAAEFSLSASALGTFPWLRHVPVGPHVKIINVFREFHRLIDKVIDRRSCPVSSIADYNNDVDDRESMTNDNPVECCLDAYLQEMKNATIGKGSFNVPLRKGNVYSNIVQLYFAGSDTVSMTLLWFLVYLLRHPDVQARCHEELDNAIGPDRTPRMSDKETLPYLQATIAEVQRVSNVTPLGIPHSTSDDIFFNGLLIPRKAMVIANLQAVVKDPNLFERPEEFNPGRFLDEDGNFVKSPKLILFGTGPRKCLGEQLAKMELFLFAATILHRFKVTLPAGEAIPRREGITGVTVKPHHFRMCATLRLTND